MANINFNSKKALKICLIVYAVLFIIGIVMTAIMGVSLDINFSGGTRISYSYTGEIAEADFEKTVGEVITQDFSVAKNTSLAGDVTTMTITLTGKDALASSAQEDLSEKLTKAYPDNKIELYDSNSVSPTIAGSFFAKSLVAVLITAVLVVIYVSIRFKKIGGFSAAITAFVAVVLDVLTTFFICAIFRLQIDSNYLAVVLTILGYSLNDTIVVYDRVRENKKLYPQKSVTELMDISTQGIIRRNIITTVTTVLAILTIIVVAEIYGLTSLRTFAIPMAFGLISGCVSSLFVAGPLWAIWQENKKTKKA